MKPRQTIVAKFSTFLQLYPMCWVKRPELERNMNRLLQQYPNRDEKFWFKYWLDAALAEIAAATGFTIAQIQRFLQTCIQAARASLKIQVESLDAEGAFSENAIANTYFEQAEIAQADAQKDWEWRKIRTILKQAVTTLPPEVQQMLLLEHGLPGFRQKEIAKILGMRQYQVSRYLERCKRPLLEALAEWSQNQAGISLTTAQIDLLSQELDAWLVWYYQNQSFFQLLENTIVQDLKEAIPLLESYYCQNLPLPTIAGKLNTSETAVTEKLTALKTTLELKLKSWVQEEIKLSPDSLNSVAQPISTLVEQWLKDAKYSTFSRARR